MDSADFQQIIVNREKLEDAVIELSGKINGSYESTEKLVIVVLLEGARRFAGDLIKNLNVPIEEVFIKASSYYGGTSSCGQVQIQSDCQINEKLAGQNILIVDDIYDTGLTLDSVIKKLKESNPKSIKTCVLLEKKICHKVDVPIDFLGMKIEDHFIVGYGLDHNQKYRELPFIAILPEAEIKAE